MSLLQNLQTRYACKAYDSTRKVCTQDLDKILEAISLAPTSSGLQPFKVLVVERQDLKDQISEGVSNVDAARECSHILILAAWDRYMPSRIDEVYDRMCQERGLPQGRFASYTDYLKKAYYEGQDSEANFAHAARQTYIAMGLALAQAAELKIDATPIEGFRPEHVDEIFGLRPQSLRAVTMIYLGYSDETRDWMKPMKKVRRPKGELVEYF